MSLKSIFLLCPLAIAAAMTIGCEQTPDSAKRDLRNTERKGTENVQRKENDVEKTKMKAAENVQKKENAVEAAKEKAAADVQKKKEKVDKAVEKEAEKH